MSKSEATTAIMPAMGAIQKTTGLLVDNDANACKGMNIFDKRCPYSLYIFLKNLVQNK
jgi:hypothetical protein